MLSKASRHLSRFSSVNSRFASTLVIVDHDNKNVLPSTLATVTAAKKIGGDITLLVGGHNCSSVSQAAAKIDGVKKVIVADKPQYEKGVPENVAALILKLQGSKSFTHILGGNTYLGKSALPRVAATLDVNQISEVIAVSSETAFVRPMYAGNALAHVESSDAVKVVTVRSTAFEKAAVGDKAAEIESVDITEDAGLSVVEGQNIVKSDRPDLQAAKVVICGGRGLKDDQNFEKLMYPLAERLGAAVGATRAACDAKFCSPEIQIGQTGKIIAPDLYVAFGVSGAIQHLTGMKDSKTIMCVNKDAEAPLFAVADCGLVGDLFTVIPEMQTLLKK